MKGHRTVVEAAARLAAAGSPLPPAADRAGALRAEGARARSSAAGLGDRISILGFVDDLPAAMAALDVALYSALESDGMSRVLFEYLAAGRAGGGQPRRRGARDPGGRPHRAAGAGRRARPAGRRHRATARRPGPAARARRGRGARWSAPDTPARGSPSSSPRSTCRSRSRGPAVVVKVSVLCFDVSDNAVGRAWLLARLLEPLGAVEIVGPRFGAAVWEPLAEESIPVRSLPGEAASRPSRPGCPRSPGWPTATSSTPPSPGSTSAGIGYLARLAGRRPLLLDVDDWEVGFFLPRRAAGAPSGRALNLCNPRGLPWTWLMERMMGLADGDHGRLPLPRAAIRRHAHPPRARHRSLGARPRRPRPGARAGSAWARSAWSCSSARPAAYKGVDGPGRRGGPDRPVRRASWPWSAPTPSSETGRAVIAQHPGARLVGRVPFAQVPGLSRRGARGGGSAARQQRHARAGAGQALRRDGARPADRLDARVDDPGDPRGLRAARRAGRRGRASPRRSPGCSIDRTRRARSERRARRRAVERYSFDVGARRAVPAGGARARPALRPGRRTPA